MAFKSSEEIIETWNSRNMALDLTSDLEKTWKSSNFCHSKSFKIFLLLWCCFLHVFCAYYSLSFDLWVYSFPSLEIFCPLFPQILLPLTFRDSNYIYIRPLGVVSQYIDSLFLFYFFSLCFTLYTFYCYVFNSLIFPFAMSLIFMQCIFHLSYYRFCL